MWDGNPACIPICGRAFAVARYGVDVVKPRCTLPSQHPFPRTRGPLSIRPDLCAYSPSGGCTSRPVLLATHSFWTRPRLDSC